MIKFKEAAAFFSVVSCMVSPNSTYASDIIFPPDMGRILSEVCVNNPELGGARTDASASGYTADYAHYLHFPRVELNSYVGDSGNRIVSTDVKQTIWDGGRISSDIDSMEERNKADTFKIKSKGDDLSLRVMDAYLNLLRVGEQETISQANVAKHEAYYESSMKRRDSGLGNVSDVEMVLSRLQQAKANLLYWQGEKKKYATSYASLVGHAPPENTVIIPEGDNLFSMGMDEVIAKAIARSPVLEALRHEVSVAKADVDHSEAQNFPVLFAKANYSDGENKGSSVQTGTSVTLNLQWQNDVGLSQRLQTKSAKQKVRSSEYAVQTAENNLRELVSGFYTAYATAESKKGELVKFKQSAATTVEMYEKQFIIGRRSWPDLVNSLQDLYNAESQLKDAEYQSALFSLKLQVLAGVMDRQMSCKAD